MKRHTVQMAATQTVLPWDQAHQGLAEALAGWNQDLKPGPENGLSVRLG